MSKANKPWYEDDTFLLDKVGTHICARGPYRYIYGIIKRIEMTYGSMPTVVIMDADGREHSVPADKVVREITVPPRESESRSVIVGPDGNEHTVYLSAHPVVCGDLDGDDDYSEEGSLVPTRIIFNPPATIVYWEDGDKTVVKCEEGTEFNEYFGFCAALAKRIYGNNSQVKKHLAIAGEYAKKPKKKVKKDKPAEPQHEPNKLPEEDIDNQIDPQMDDILTRIMKGQMDFDDVFAKLFMGKQPGYESNKRGNRHD